MAHFGSRSAGMGFGGRNGTQTKKPMGIQFVKSSEQVSPQKQSPHAPDKVSSSGPKPLLSLPVSSNQCVQPSFGGPAVNFAPKVGGGFQSGPLPSRYKQAFVKSAENYSTQQGASSSGGGYRMPFVSSFKPSTSSNSSSASTFPLVPEAKPVCSVDEYLKAWKAEKDPVLTKLRKFAYEVVTLKSDRPNAKDKMHSAANRVPLHVEFNIEPQFGPRGFQSFLCYVYFDNISVASGQGAKRKVSKTNAYEAALQKVLMPYLRVIPIDPSSCELQGSKEPFTSPPPEPSKVPLNLLSKDNSTEIPSLHKESNLESAGLKRRHNEYKKLDEFVIVEPSVVIQDCTPAHTLRRSADFNHMLLEYEYFFKGEAARCVLKIENQVLADVNGNSKNAAKNKASVQALFYLKKFCWIIKTKQAVDSNTKISKEEMLNELNEQSDIITDDNIGNKMLRKMGWSGGGVGKDGDGIAEPVSLKSVLNREGLGLSASKGITDDFRKRIKEVIENYASSENQEDLVFSYDFRLEERQIVHDECRRLNLRSKCKGKGGKRYLCVRRKRSVNQLFDHLMSVGGETARYKLIPPGGDEIVIKEPAAPFPSSTQQTPCPQESAGKSIGSGANLHQSRTSVSSHNTRGKNNMLAANQWDRSSGSESQSANNAHAFPNQQQLLVTNILTNAVMQQCMAKNSSNSNNFTGVGNGSFGLNTFHAGNFGNAQFSKDSNPQGAHKNGPQNSMNGGVPYNGAARSGSHSTNSGGCSAANNFSRDSMGEATYGGKSNCDSGTGSRQWNQQPSRPNANPLNTGASATLPQNKYPYQQSDFASNNTSSSSGSFRRNNCQSGQSQPSGNSFFNHAGGFNSGTMPAATRQGVGMGGGGFSGGGTPQGYFPMNNCGSSTGYNNNTHQQAMGERPGSGQLQSWNPAGQTAPQWSNGQGQVGMWKNNSNSSSNNLSNHNNQAFNFNSGPGQGQGMQYANTGGFYRGGYR